MKGQWRCILLPLPLAREGRGGGANPATDRAKFRERFRPTRRALRARRPPPQAGEVRKASRAPTHAIAHLVRDEVPIPVVSNQLLRRLVVELEETSRDRRLAARAGSRKNNAGSRVRSETARRRLRAVRSITTSLPPTDTWGALSPSAIRCRLWATLGVSSPASMRATIALPIRPVQPKIGLQPDLGERRIGECRQRQRADDQGAREFHAVSADPHQQKHRPQAASQTCQRRQRQQRKQHKSRRQVGKRHFERRDPQREQRNRHAGQQAGADRWPVPGWPRWFAALIPPWRLVGGTVPRVRSAIAGPRIPALTRH